MVTGSMYVELLIPGIRSLKEKRAVVNKLKTRLANLFNISIAEVSHQDLLQRSGLGVAIVSHSANQIEGIFEAIHDKINSFASVQIVTIEKGVY